MERSTELAVTTATLLQTTTTPATDTRETNTIRSTPSLTVSVRSRRAITTTLITIIEMRPTIRRQDSMNRETPSSLDHTPRRRFKIHKQPLPERLLTTLTRAARTTNTLASLHPSRQMGAAAIPMLSVIIYLERLSVRAHLGRSNWALTFSLARR